MSEQNNAPRNNNNPVNFGNDQDKTHAYDPKKDETLKKNKR